MRSMKVMRGMWLLGAVTMGLTACLPSVSTNTSSRGSVVATTGVPSYAVTSPSPVLKTAAVGSTLRVTDDSGDIADYTLTSLRTGTSNPYVQPKGTVYAIDVTVQTLSGTVTVNPLDWNLKSADGTKYRSNIGVVDPQMSVTEVPQGDKYRGQTGFDLPLTTVISAISLEGVGGEQLARWTV